MRYVLEGSVRRSRNQLRVSAQLIDAETDAHMWAERFDHDTDDLFVLQNEITSRIANALEVELITAEAARPTEHPDALDYILRGRAARLKPNSRDSFVERISLFEHALALDPQSVEAQTRLASSLAGRVFDLLTGSAAADLTRAERLVGQALAASPRYALAHHVKGQVLRAQNRWEEAIPEYETVIELDRNAPGAYANLGWCKFLTGSIEDAIPALEQALRLSPRDHRAGNWCGRIGMVHLLQSRTDEAILWLEKGASASPALPFVHAFLASAYGLKGETERAAAKLAEARRLRGEGSLFGHRPHAGKGAEDPRPIRSDIFRRAAEGRRAGGVRPPLGARGHGSRTARRRCPVACPHPFLRTFSRIFRGLSGGFPRHLESRTIPSPAGANLLKNRAQVTAWKEASTPDCFPSL